MKKIFLPFLAITLLLTGCLENVQEVTINEDGSGTLHTTSDMGSLIALAKQMDDGEMEKSAEEKMDTVFYFREWVDDAEDLTDEEKKLMSGGRLRVKTDMAADTFRLSTDFGFSAVSDIEKINRLTSRFMIEFLKEKAGGGSNNEDAGAAVPNMSSFDDYFITTYTKGSIEKKLNKSQYALADKDEFLTSVRQTSSMGLVMKTTYIYNLPRPATKVEGAGISLSADKKKITITGDIDNFFDDPSLFEFKVEY